MSGVSGIVTVNPATGDELDFYPYTTPQDLDRVLDRAAASRWGRSGVADRVAAIGRLGDILAERREPLAALVTLEMGKPIRQARAEIDKCVTAAATTPGSFPRSCGRRPSTSTATPGSSGSCRSGWCSRSSRGTTRGGR